MVLFKPKPIWQFELSGSPPFSFKLTVHKPRYGYWLTPFEIYKDEKIWSGMRLFNKTSLGLELAFFNLFSFRAGAYCGYPTLGAGIRIYMFKFDYAYMHNGFYNNIYYVFDSPLHIIQLKFSM